MSFIALAFAAGLLLFVFMTLLWAISLHLRNASIVDIFWGFGFILVYWLSAALASQENSPRQLILGLLVTIWGMRLSIHILRRNKGKGEDFRYARWRQKAGSDWWWRSYFKVFLLQGAIMWLVSAPLIAAQASRTSPALNGLDYLGVALWLIGFLFEAVGDWQLVRFKDDPSNRGKLLDTGLWRYTRHPNYFGDAVQWWGFYALAAAAGGWWSIFSPLLMTYLLRYVSGVAMLERTMRKTKPDYAAYIASTNAFIPWFPRKPTKVETPVSSSNNL